MTYIRLFHRPSQKNITIALTNTDETPNLFEKCSILINKRTGTHIAMNTMATQPYQHMRLIQRIRHSTYSDAMRHIWGTCKTRLVNTENMIAHIHATYRRNQGR